VQTTGPSTLFDNTDEPSRRRATFPVFRRASVLSFPSADGTVTPRQSVEIGRSLKAHSGDFIEKLTSFLQTASPILTDARLVKGANPDRPRIRLDPAIIVDFPIIRLTWHNLEIETRVGMITWSGARKAKLWTRFHVTTQVSDPEVVRQFFADFKLVSKVINEFCVNYHSTTITFPGTGDQRRGAGFNKLTPYYTIMISAVSSSNSSLLYEIDAESEFHRRPSRQRLEKCVRTILVDEYGIELPPLTKSLTSKFQRNFNCFVYPIINPTIISKRHALLSTKIGPDKFQDSEALDELKCITVTDTFSDRAEVWAVVYEEYPLEEHRQSGPLIVSAELSLMLGGLY
jgi:hypothetical protein